MKAPPASLVNKRTPKPNVTGDERSDPKSAFSSRFFLRFIVGVFLKKFFWAQATFCLKDRVKSKK